MGKAKVWKMGDKWAGISTRGKRVVKNTKSAAQTAVGIKSKSSSVTTKKNKKKSVKKTAKKKTKRRYKMTIPIAPVAGFGVGMIEPISYLLKGNLMMFLDKIAYHYTGWNNSSQRVELAGMKRGLLPLIIGLLVHKFVGGTLGANRMLGRAKVPIIRI